MKTKIIKEPVYETKTIKTKIADKDKTVYIAEDGKEFDFENECLNYEIELQTVLYGKQYVTEIKIDYDEQVNIITLLFGGSDISCVQIFKWIATKDENILNLTYKYLRIKGCRDHQFELKNFDEGDKIFIISWIENDHTDYPYDFTKVINISDAINMIDKCVNKMKLVFN